MRQKTLKYTVPFWAFWVLLVNTLGHVYAHDCKIKGKNIQWKNQERLCCGQKTSPHKVQFSKPSCCKTSKIDLKTSKVLESQKADNSNAAYVLTSSWPSFVLAQVIIEKSTGFLRAKAPPIVHKDFLALFCILLI